MLAGDFETFAVCGSRPAGDNNPIVGSTPIAPDTWYHAAFTYDGTALRLYLNGKLDATLASACDPRYDNSQPAGLGTMLDSNSTPPTNGFFQGVLDESRIWNAALTQGQILANINKPVTSGAGLLARWGMDEGTGTTIASSAGTFPGTLTNGPIWVPGAPFDLDLAPDTPVLVAPTNGATGVAMPVELKVHVDDARNSELTVSFYGRPKSGPPGVDFSLIAIPDPQYYASTYPSIYNAQMNWVVANKTSSNIPYVVSLGDNVDDASSTTQWGNAANAWDLLTAGGVPYGLQLGNHDGAPSATGNFNTYFGSRLSTQATYGGRYGTSDYDNTYATFSASGMDFIVLFIEYDTTMTATSNPVLVWANGVLQANPTRRAIVVTHDLLNGNSFTGQGAAIYNALKANPSLFLMLGGHLDTTGQRSDTYNGNTVYSLRSDYQFVDSRQSGYLRVMRFSPANNRIYITTYSPTQSKNLTDSANQFELSYAMASAPAFTLIGSTTVAAGSDATVTWSGLNGSTEYEWYAISGNTAASATSPTWSFTTAAASNQPPVITEGASTSVTMSEDGSPTPFSLTLHATDEDPGDTLTWSISTPAINGTASTSGTGASVVVGYTPIANYNGSDSFVVQVSDGNGGMDTITVNVTIEPVNDVPACSDTTLTTPEDTVGEVAPACTDADIGDTLTYSVVDQPSHGAASVVAGKLSYVPAADYNGPDSFTYKANDTHLDSNTATVDVTVTSVNDPPVVTNPGVQANAEGDSVSLQIDASDVDGPAPTYSAVNLPEGLSINTGSGLISGNIAYHAAFDSPYTAAVTVSDGTASIQVNFTWMVTEVASGLCTGPTADLVGCWPMEESSGPVVIDATVNGNDGTTVAAPPWVAGKLGVWALSFNGTTQNVSVPDDSSLDIQSQITIAAWIRLGKPGTQDVIKKSVLMPTQSAGTDGYELSYSNASQFFLRFDQKTSGEYVQGQ